MSSLRVKAVAILMLKTDKLNKKLYSIFRDRFGEVDAEAYYKLCNAIYNNFENANIMIECKQVPKVILHSVVEQRGNNYDKLCAVLQQAFAPDEASKIIAIYRDLADTSVLVEEITTKNLLVANKIAKKAVKNNSDVVEPTLGK